MSKLKKMDKLFKEWQYAGGLFTQLNNVLNINVNFY